MIFKTWLLNKRQSKGLTQVELAKETGLSDISVCNFENGIKVPSVRSITKLSHYFGTKTETIYKMVQRQLKESEKR